MIDKKIFVQEMAVLCDRFGRELTQPVLDRYYESLSEKLNTQQFKTASKSIFIEEEFFPSPQKFFQKVLANTEDLAVLEWERVLNAAAQANYDIELTEAGKKAVRALGGISAIGRADLEFAVPRIRKEFIQSYKAHSSLSADYLLSLPASKEGVIEDSNNRRNEGMVSISDCLETN